MFFLRSRTEWWKGTHEKHKAKIAKIELTALQGKMSDREKVRRYYKQICEYREQGRSWRDVPLLDPNDEHLRRRAFEYWNMGQKPPDD
jgi:hypothetical protein